MELLLFALDDAAVIDAAAAGVDGIVVDLEHRGKEMRQVGFDTDVSSQTLDDVRRIRSLTDLPVIVRVDGPGEDLEVQLSSVRAAGADEALVPMVPDADVVAACLEAAPPGLPVGVLVERASAVDDVERIAGLPISRMYVGLMDLMIERRASTPFEALVDGTVARVRAAARQPFGVGGLTAPEHGTPIPAALLASELAALETDFTFLRRSFYSAVADLGVVPAVAEIRAMLSELDARPSAKVAADRQAFRAHVRASTS